MTDLEAFLALYARFGITLEAVRDPDETQSVFLGEYYGDKGHLVPDDGGKFEGYTGFFSAVTFDKDGRFLRQGFWE